MSDVVIAETKSILPRQDDGIADLIDESVISFGFDMKVTAWNREAERIYGWKRDEVVGGVIQAAVKCSPSEPLKVILEKVHATGLWRGEFTRTTKTGAPVVVRAKWVLRRASDGTPADIVEMSTDITDVRRTEEALGRIQYQYQNLFQASVASFWELEFGAVGGMVRELVRTGVTDLRAYFREHPEFVRSMIQATRIVDFNEQSFSMFGRGDRDELKASLDPLWPDESLGVFAQSVAAALENKPHFSAEAVFVSLDGRRYDTIFNVSYPPVLLHSSRLLVGIIDVTQGKKARLAQESSERKYRDLFHFLPVALLRLEGQRLTEIYQDARAAGVTDFEDYLKQRPDIFAKALDGLRIAEANPRAVEMLRARTVEELHGPVARYWTESPEIIRSSLAARYAGKRGFEALVKMPAHDGTVLDALFFAAFAPVTGDPSSSIVGLIDVSDRVRAQDMLAKVQAEMAHAARVSVLGELTASIAHEVSQPLTAIQSNTEASLLWLARSPPDFAEVLKLSERTVAEAERAANIIQRIRSMAVHTVTDKQKINLNAVIDEAILFLGHEFQRYEVRSSMHLDPAIPMIVGDRVQLQQVVVNLAINAVQAMAAVTGAESHITIRTNTLAGSDVSIVIEDTGPGIPIELRGRIFDSFFTTKSAGMGIGLAICRSIVESHGGRISVGDRKNRQGARFEIVLPAAPNET